MTTPASTTPASITPAPTTAPPFDFTDRRVLVVGGTSGINLGIAEAFAAAGARLAVISRSPAKVTAAVERLSAHGRAATGAAADVRDAEAIARAIDNCAAALGEGIDVLVSGAAGNFPAPLLGMSSRGFGAVVGIDLIGSFNVLGAAHPHLAKPGGVVLHISAPQALHAMVLQGHVCAAKAGVDMLTRVAALEWGCDGIRVNSVVPGPIAETEGMARLAPTPEMERAVAATVPLGRLGTKADVADLCLFLASPWASFVTGAVIPVDGGIAAGGGGALASGMGQLRAVQKAAAADAAAG
jgi:NAD(P)-dependent dehydrogenase (short-subunit alcohol dehydrogenase family)